MSDALKPLGAALPPRIAALEARANAVLSLTEQVRAVLPEAEKKHLLSASYRDSTLIVLMDSAAWCPQIRYAADPLLARLRAAGGPDFVNLKVKVGRVSRQA